jgi:CTP:molybdopterin cytidylyltransferase MocA
MFYSLQLALQSIATTNGALLLPLDTPAPPVEFWQNFLHFIGHNGQTNITPSYQGKRGHPVFLASDLIKKINAQNWHQTESRLDYLLQHERQNHNVLDYPCQESLVVANINYPEDLKHQ